VFGFRVFLSFSMFPPSRAQLRYCLTMLKLKWRRRMSMHFHRVYLSGNTFYKATLDGRVSNVDQLLTVDIERFCTSLADLYSNVTKPALDVILFSRRLAQTLGPAAPAYMLSYFVLCSVLLRSVQPPFGQLTADEQKVEGEYRLHHSRLIVHAEEVAFYSGGDREKIYINRALEGVLAHAKKLASARWFIGVIDSLLVKYIATIVGYTVVSIPVFWPQASFLGALFPHLAARRRAAAAARSAAACGTDPAGKPSDPALSSSNIAGLYTRNSRLLLQLAGAIGRLVVSSKEITRLTGYAYRVSTLQDVLHDMSHANAVRNRFESSPDLARDLRMAELMRPGKLVVGSVDDGPEANVIRFENVNLISPDSTCLVEGLTFELARGSHCMLTGYDVEHCFRPLSLFLSLPLSTTSSFPAHRLFGGSSRDVSRIGCHADMCFRSISPLRACRALFHRANGSGKSSAMRVLAGLWPLYGGTLYRPSRDSLFYVPQRPYLAMGTLRDNLVYPMTWAEAVEQRGFSDYKAFELLEQVHLEDLVRRKGGLDAVQDWSESLSGGQKQRMSFARLLFNKPVYAILDEASVSRCVVPSTPTWVCVLLSICFFPSRSNRPASANARIHSVRSRPYHSTSRARSTKLSRIMAPLSSAFPIVRRCGSITKCV
jgi:ATP-binding cassette, subfamily D (ALD), peroxisomal long-chain fatty acid import protein